MVSARFASMKKGLLILGLMVFTLASLQAQTTYYTGFNNTDQQIGWQRFELGKKISGWSVQDGGVGNTKRIVSYAPTGDADKDTFYDWYVSPKMDFSKGGSIDTLKYNYFAYFGTFFPEQRVKVMVLAGSQDPSKADSMIEIADFTDFYIGDNQAWTDTGGFVIPNIPGDAYIGFLFVGIDGWSNISYDDLYVTMNATSSVQELPVLTTSVYPNPSSGTINVVFDGVQPETLELNVFDSQGKLLQTKQVPVSGSIDLELSNGLYFYQLSSGSQVSALQRLVVVKE